MTPDITQTSPVDASFRVTGQGVLVRDAGSTNGTSVQGRAVTETAVLIPPGAGVRVGSVALRVAPAPGSDMATADRGAGPGPRKVPWLAIIGGSTALVGAVVGVLTYLQSRPSPIAEYRDQIATVCQAGAARQVKVDAAFTADGYDRRLFTALAAQAPASDSVVLEDLIDLRPPEELATKHQEAITLMERTIAADREYVASLEGLPDSEFRRRYPEFPGDTSALDAVRRELGAVLVTLSGGKCADVKS